MTETDKLILHLEQEIYPSVNDAFDKLDYRSIRAELRTVRAGYIDIRNLSDDPPPVNLSMGIKGFCALQRLLAIVGESGLLYIVREQAGRFGPHARDLLPTFDVQLIDDDKLLHRILEITAETADDQLLSDEDLKQLYQIKPSAIARALVVNPVDPRPWADRRKVSSQQTAKRLRVAGTLTKMLAGGVLLGANAACGVLTTCMFTLPVFIGEVSSAVAIVSSATAGLTTIGNGLRELSEEI